MIVTFCPYQFILIGTEQCGVTKGEIHSLRIHVTAGAWATRHAGRTEVYHDLPVNLGRSESDLMARKIAENIEYYSLSRQELSITEDCLRQGGISSVGQSSLGRTGPCPLPSARGFEQYVSLFSMQDTGHLDHHYDRPSDAVSLTVMAGMVVKAMAAQDWESVGKVLDQAWRLRVDTIPQAILDRYNLLKLAGAWGCAWVGPDVLLAVGDRHAMISALDIDEAVREIPYHISDEGARPRALIDL